MSKTTLNQSCSRRPGAREVRGDLMAAGSPSPGLSPGVRAAPARHGVLRPRRGLLQRHRYVVLVTPGALGLVDVQESYSNFWNVAAGLTGLFAGIVLLLSAMDLETFASFPYWNGIIRLAFVIATVALGFGSSTGTFALVLAAGDVPLAFGCIFGLPHAVGRSHLQLLANQAAA
jgi:hypothetical protein